MLICWFKNVSIYNLERLCYSFFYSVQHIVLDRRERKRSCRIDKKILQRDLLYSQRHRRGYGHFLELTSYKAAKQIRSREDRCKFVSLILFDCICESYRASVHMCYSRVAQVA